MQHMTKRRSGKIKQIAALLLLHSSITCASQPDWVDGTPRAYPDNDYITASASASDPERAKDRALGNLSKVFEARIDDQTTTRSDTHVTVKDGDESFTRQHFLSQQVRVSSDKIINGARIAETWKDDKLFVYHALAVLDRKQAGNNIRQEMHRLDEQTQSELQHSQTQADQLVALSALNSAIELQQQRYGLQKMLKVIDSRGVGHPSEWNMSDLQSRFQSHLNSLKVGVAVDNDPIGKLEQLLSSAMGNAGFPAVPNGSDFTLVASLDVQDLGLRQGWYWLRGKLSLRLIEKSGKVRGRQQWPLKVSALQQSEAESRLLTQVSRKLNAELRNAMIQFASVK